MKIGRNDPCPCGSGKKYKKCCLIDKPEVGDLLWHKLRAIHDDMADRLTKHGRKRFGEKCLDEASEEFWFWGDYEVLESDVDVQLVAPFFLYNWLPDIKTETYKVAPKDTTIALDFLEKSRPSLTDLEERFIDESLKEPFSFWEVVEVDQGEGFLIKDCFLGVEAKVTEKSGSQSAKIGDILFTKVIQIDHVGMLCGCGWVLVPPVYKKEILDLRKEMQSSPHAVNGVISKETLHDFDMELREVFLKLQKRIMSPPTLCNTDGDIMSLHKITYELDSAQEAFGALASLCLSESHEELLKSAKFKDGILYSVEFSWQKRGNKMHDWDNTVMGRLAIEGNKLEIDVNSANRAKIIKKKITQRLKDTARHKSTVVQSPEALMKSPRRKDPEQLRKDEEHRKLMESPEVQKMLREMSQKHWDNWFNEKIPALGNTTPLQASKTSEGRELLEALLNQYQRNDSTGNDLYQPDWKVVKERLGLET